MELTSDWVLRMSGRPKSRCSNGRAAAAYLVRRSIGSNVQQCGRVEYGSVDELVNIVHETGAGDVEWDDGEEEAVTAHGMRLMRWMAW